MSQVAKVFRNGRSQAVRLPAAFRFDTREVFVRRDNITGDLILSRRPADWEDLFEASDRVGTEGEGFLIDRGDSTPQVRELF